MDSYERFHELLRRDFLPLLRADGFKGSGTTSRRLLADRIDVVNVQGSRSGGNCCVNVAVHFSFLPSAGGGRVPEWKKLKEYECAFRNRLHEASEADHWWTYGVSDSEAEASLARLIDTYRRRSALFFGKFEPFPHVFEQITPAEIDAGDLSNMPPGSLTGVLAALTMARIMSHLGRREKCREFAEVGLRHLGRAVGLKTEFERLRDAS
jgi:hypothetical protein